MTTTPPLRTIAHTPPTPLHGAKYDNYQPYPTRRSTRFLKQRATRTPSPENTIRLLQAKTSLNSKRASAVQPVAHTYSPPSSTQNSPKNLRTNNMPKPEVISAMRDEESTKKSNSLHPVSEVLTSEQTTTLLNNMLPTPAKTPRKRAFQAGIGSTARILFPNKHDNVDEAMPTPRKNGRNSKKHIGFSLDSFGEDDGTSSEGKIEIYTDSKEKLPELDESEDNPFYAQPGQEVPQATRSSKRRKVSGKPSTNSELEEAFKREDGMVYVFRGKKIFRKFPEPDALSDTDDIALSLPFSDNPVDLSTSPGSHSYSGPMTRSSIKPRLLFPTKAQLAARLPPAPTNLSDEEAVTDIEISAEEEEKVVTPVKQTFAPASPPTTGRATRATERRRMQEEREKDNLDVGLGLGLEAQGVKKKRGSPFDGWARTKASAGAGVGIGAEKGKKRQGDVLEKGKKGEEGDKRVKINGI